MGMTMKKQELLKIMDDALLEKLFGFCYARTNDSYEAQELCSDILFALVKTANTTGDITDIYPFIWRVARNVYADFSKYRKKHIDLFYQGDPSDVLSSVLTVEEEDDSEELLQKVYHRVSFLTKAYREVMILYYLDGLSTAEIAKRQNISETAVRQRLFSARNKIKKEVTTMADNQQKPILLDKIDFNMIGHGNPLWGDPRSVCTRQLSKHIVWLCRKKPLSALEISEKLNVPTIYVEEEFEILTRGENGEYGLLRQLDNGKYAINFILLDKEETEKAWEIYQSYVPVVCDKLSELINAHKQNYLKFPYLNKKVEPNLVLWQQIAVLSRTFSGHVERLLRQKHFADVSPLIRPFTVCGYLDNGIFYGDGWDNIKAENICGFSDITVDNIYNSRIKEHFVCGHNIAKDAQLQLALRAIRGLDINTLSSIEKEYAAKAIESGYLYREEEMLYTKILVCDMKNKHQLFTLSNNLSEGIFETEAEEAAERIAGLIHRIVPDYLISEWWAVVDIARMPMVHSITEALVERGILIPPEDGIGAEGCWMSVLQAHKESNKKKVLIVDDAPFIRNVLTEELSMYCQIITAEDGEEGIVKFKNERPDAVLLDINMPKLSGVDALKQMVEINAKARIIMVSAVDDKEVIDRCKSLGAAHYIVKPFNLNQILQALSGDYDVKSLNHEEIVVSQNANLLY